VAVIYTVMGLLNFAQGEFIMVPAYALYVLAGVPFGGGRRPAHWLTGIVLAVLAERVAFRPVRGADPSAQLVTSLAGRGNPAERGRRRGQRPAAISGDTESPGMNRRPSGPSRFQTWRW